MIHIGIDEAGLGPTLGPMVVAGFSFSGLNDCCSLGRVMQQAIGEPGTAAPRVEVGDSKLIHRGTRKLARLERTVLATLAWIHGDIPKTSDELLQWTTQGNDAKNLAPWYHQVQENLPIVASRDEIFESSELLIEVAKQRGITALGFHADVISEQRFNRDMKREYAQGGSKNTWATQRLVDHAGLLIDKFSDLEMAHQGIRVECDRAGARMMYSPQIERRLDADRILILQETNLRSQYRIVSSGDSNRSLEIGFQVRADSVFTHVAWASCLAKYLREIIMRCFNRYWIDTFPLLRPTAGYPQDAKRFISEIRHKSHEIRLSEQQWIRMA